MTFDPLAAIVPMKSEVGEYFSLVIAGPGGTGKSTLLGSMAEYIHKTYGKRTLLIATLPREKRSWKYQQLGDSCIDHVLVEDTDWRPDARRFQADGFSKMQQILEYLETDTKYGGVIVDNGTEHAEQAWHASLAPLSVGSPMEIDGKSRWLPYERLDSLLDQSIKSMVSLTTAANPKFVGIAWHVQAPKEDTVETVGDSKVAKKSADNTAKGVEYEGDVLPMIRGKFRRKLINQVDAMLYTEIANRRDLVDGKIQEKVEYLVQVRANPERHTKLPGPMPSVGHIPNDFTALVQVMRNEYKPVEQKAEVNLNFSGRKK